MPSKRKIWLSSAVILVVVLGGALAFCGPLRVRLLLNKTYYYQNKGDFESALRLSRQLMEQYPDRRDVPRRYAEVALWRARWLADQKQPEASRKIADEALELVPKDRELLEYLLYMDRLHFYDFDRARSLAQRLLEDDPDNLMALFTLSDAGYNYNSPGNIPPELDRYLELASKMGQTDTYYFYYLKGLRQFSDGDCAEAYKSFEKLKSFGRFNVWAGALGAESLLRLGKKEEALVQLLTLRDTIWVPRVQFLLAELFAEQGDFARAHYHFDCAVQLKFPARQALINVLAHRRPDEEPATASQAVAGLEQPDSSWGLTVNLARLYFETLLADTETAQARKVVEILQQAEGADWDLRRSRVELALMQGNLAEARDQLGRMPDRMSGVIPFWLRRIDLSRRELGALDGWHEWKPELSGFAAPQALDLPDPMFLAADGATTLPLQLAPGREGLFLAVVSLSSTASPGALIGFSQGERSLGRVYLNSREPFLFVGRLPRDSSQTQISLRLENASNFLPRSKDGEKVSLEILQWLFYPSKEERSAAAVGISTGI